MCEWQEYLITTKGEINEQTNDAFLDELDEIWYSATYEETQEMRS